MHLAWTGVLVLIVTGAVFALCLPRNGKTHRLVGTEFEPYVAVALVAGIALGFSMVFSGLTG